MTISLALQAAAVERMAVNQAGHVTMLRERVDLRSWDAKKRSEDELRTQEAFLEPLVAAARTLRFLADNEKAKEEAGRAAA